MTRSKWFKPALYIVAGLAVAVLTPVGPWFRALLVKIGVAK